MSTCTYCGRENPEEIPTCRECGSALGKQMRTATGPTLRQWLSQPVSLRAKVCFWGAAWTAVALAALYMNPEYLIAAPVFPVGLFCFFPGGETTAIKCWMLVYPIFLGWGLYAFMLWVMSYTVKKGTFLPAYTVFCILLSLNMDGCRRTLEAAAQIH